jgi:uncharacterized protein
MSPRPPNRLALETSPYLVAHAHNPVDWNPWDRSALSRAKLENRPIFLSIGYAACHWCHVMERESFEDERIAAVLNRHFVPIKVDRQQRPDLDEIYMAATVALNESGGWPMSVFLTPELEPFFAGTYFPPHDIGPYPGFLGLITRIADLWEHERATLFAQARSLTEFVRQRWAAEPAETVGADHVERAAQDLARAFDPPFGGFSPAPKFPPHAPLRLLMRHHRSTGDRGAIEMVTATLDGMKNGGIFDQLGGGFARYSTDDAWRVPHFEKMLSDNAELAGVYLEAYQATGDSEYRRVAVETLDFVLREMQGPDGGFHAATDADSEGQEGKFFLFAADEIAACLTPEEYRPFCLRYGVTEGGQWQGKNVLYVARALPEIAAELGVGTDRLARLLERARAKVFHARGLRIRPAVDDQIITAPNGLMIRALAEAAQILGAPSYLEAAERGAAFVLDRLRESDGRLRRSARGRDARGSAFLDDYAYLADALVSLYEAAGSADWLARSVELVGFMLGDFGSEGGFFQTADLHEPLIARARFGHDGALPSANAVAARALARLSHHLDRPEWRERARSAIMAHGHEIGRAPAAFATSLCALGVLEDSPLELVLVGSPDRPDTEALSRTIVEFYLPDCVVGRLDPARPHATPLVTGKTLVRGRAALYLCRNHRCEAPLTSPDEVRDALGSHAAETLGSHRLLDGHRALGHGAQVH